MKVPVPMIVGSKAGVIVIAALLIGIAIYVAKDQQASSGMRRN